MDNEITTSDLKNFLLIINHTKANLMTVSLSLMYFNSMLDEEFINNLKEDIFLVQNGLNKLKYDLKLFDILE